MNIVVPVKIVLDDQDIVVNADGSLDESKARPVPSSYDLNALEVAVRLAEGDPEAKVTVVSVGASYIDDSKLKKGILARGADKIVMVADDKCGDLDAWQTANMLAATVAGAGGFDLIVCGDGSADNYAQQVDVQLAAALHIPVITAAATVVVQDGMVQCDRVLETCVQTVKADLPAVVSVVPDAAVPRIAGMKDILAAGKKPAEVVPATDVAQASVETVEVKAPEQVDRRQEIFDVSDEGGVASFVRALRAAL
ncbi:electron transfer flavoprotein [Adlercreutzia sp. R21]|uniref:electron transfer flavoprotein n=1 Tax=Adlercreutzia wanghongyangiae TaxID=3111451 RepID=UPI002DBC350C|nr:electron transfer flavoprotein [Adlercreutzia sp. R21]MEC4183265.1 electron transfer flavoprotein [Adlercreutzia sp. R21]